MKIRYLYHEVPPWGHCKSKMTGYFVNENCLGKDEIIRALKRGEYIYAKGDISTSNCFCINCGVNWYAPIKEQWLTKEEIKIKKLEKGITEEMIERTSSKLEEENEINSHKNSNGIKGKVKNGVRHLVSGMLGL